MRKIIQKVLLIAWIIINILFFIGFWGTQYDKKTAKNVLVDAEVTYVREYYNHHGYKGVATTKYLRKNGYISWEYNGEVHHYEDEKTSYFDFTPDQQIGDIVKIWVRSDNGNFVKAENENGTFIGCFLLLMADAVLIYRAVQKSKHKKKQ